MPELIPKNNGPFKRAGTVQRNDFAQNAQFGQSVRGGSLETPEVTPLYTAAIKRVLARQVEAAMKEKHFSKAEMAHPLTFKSLHTTLQVKKEF